MGFPVAIETDSTEVIDAAEAAWGGYPGLSEAVPVLIRVVVSGASAERQNAFEPSRVRFEAEWITIDHSPGDWDRSNRARGNLAEGWGDIHLTEDRARDPDYVRYHFLEPLAYLLLAPPHFAFIHAACVDLDGHAAVLCGDSGAGKTCLAFACARRGWTFLSGDATHLLHASRRPGSAVQGSHVGAAVQASHDFAVAGRPKSIRFRESARDLFPELATWSASPRPNGQLAIEADTGALNLRTASRSQASHLIFLERRLGGGCRVHNMPLAETMRRLEETIFFGDEKIRGQQRVTLSRFAELPAFRLVYSDLDSAEATLRALMSGRIR